MDKGSVFDEMERRGIISSDEFDKFWDVKYDEILDAIINKSDILGRRDIIPYLWSILPEDTKKQNIQYYLEYFGMDDKRELFDELSATNVELINADLRILDDVIIDTLGKDKVNLISCYPYVVERILEIANEVDGKKKLQVYF